MIRELVAAIGFFTAIANIPDPFLPLSKNISTTCMTTLQQGLENVTLACPLNYTASNITVPNPTTSSIINNNNQTRADRIQQSVLFEVDAELVAFCDPICQNTWETLFKNASSNCDMNAPLLDKKLLIPAENATRINRHTNLTTSSFFSKSYDDYHSFEMRNNNSDVNDQLLNVTLSDFWALFNVTSNAGCLQVKLFF